jgi:hypothetical protein
MQRLLLIALAVISVVFAQPPPQPGSLSPNVIYNGQIIQSNLPPTSFDTAYNVQLYAIYVPENATVVQVNVTNTNNNNCEYLALYLRTGSDGGLPCSREDYSETSYPCAGGYFFNDVYSSEVEIFDANSYYDNFQFTVNDWWYFGVGREDEYDNSSTCSYTLSVEMALNCSGNTIGDINPSDDSAECIPFFEVNTSSVVTINVPENYSYASVFKYEVLTATVGYVEMHLVSSSNYWEVVIQNYAAPSEEVFACNPSGEYVDNGNGIYNITFTCPNPRIGRLYMLLFNPETDGYNGTLTFTTLTCADNMGGQYCNSSNTALSLNSTQMFNVTVASYDIVYYYFDIPANYTGNDIVISVTEAVSENPVYLRKNGFPSPDSSYGYQEQGTDATFYLNNFDFYLSGRWYLGIYCDDDVICGFVVTVAPLTFGGLTTGFSFSGQVTTGKGGATTGIVSQTTTHPLTSGSTTAAITSGSTTAAITSAAMTTKPLTTNMNMNMNMTTGTQVTTRSITTATKVNSGSIVAPSFLAILAVCFVAIMNLF